MGLTEMGYWIMLFVVSMVIASIDTLVEMFFSGDLLMNFSLINILVNFTFFLGSAVFWIGLLLECLVVLDFTTPLEYLIRIFISFALLVLNNVVGLFFDIIRFPFTLLAEFLTANNLSTRITPLNALGQYLSFDLATFTMRLGLNLSFDSGTGAWLTAQFSIFGSSSFSEGGYSFSSVGLIGIEANLSASFFGNAGKIPFKISFQTWVQDTIRAWATTVGSPEGLFNDLRTELGG
jgi:hypothetical protein